MKKINWLDHFANLLVVILGISIAFYLESYKEESNNLKQEVKYLESLISDMNADIKALDTLQVINEAMLQSLATLSRASVGQPYGGDSVLVNSTFRIQYNPPFSPQKTTYESLKASGKMDLIGEFELRNKVVELYEQYYRGAADWDNAINEHVRDFVKPFYIHHVRFTGPGKLDPSFLSEDAFRNMIFSYRSIFVSKNEFYSQVSQRISLVQEKLQARLEALN